MGFERKQKKLSQIATNSWINVYYKILYHPNKEWKKKEKEFQEETLKDIINISINLRQIIINNVLIGFRNYSLNEGAFITHKEIVDPRLSFTKEFLAKILKENNSNYTLSRSLTFEVTKSKENKDYYEFIIRPKEIKKDDKPGLKIIKGTPIGNWGYSPIDFAYDKWMLSELNREISEYLNLKYIEGNNIFTWISFDKENNPLLNLKNGNLFIDFKVKNALELRKKYPEIEKDCFGDNLKGLINNFRNKTKKDEKTKRWIQEVDKLIKRN